MATAGRRTGRALVSPAGALSVVAPNGEVSPAPRPPVNPDDHVAWARAIGRGVATGVAGHRRFMEPFPKGSQEERELEQTAYLALLRAIRRFEPARVPAGGEVAGAFRGFCKRAIQSECRREAKRLRNGGLFNTARPELVKGLRVEGLPSERRESCRDLVPGFVPPALVVYDPDPDPDVEREDSMFDTVIDPGMEIPRPGRGNKK